MPATFATDLVTFYDPRFWGLLTPAELEQWTIEHPARFWETVLNSLTASGFQGMEVTFGSGSIESALRAFGTAEAFRAELHDRALSVTSAFMAGVDAPDWLTADTGTIVADAVRRATFLAEVGGSVLVTGLPLRRTFGERPPFFVDLGYMTRMAHIAHAVGEAVSRHGVRLAFHPESNSTFWYERDIDLFLSLTDPEYVWFCPDSCHIALGGGDPVAVARRHQSRIALAHWKDAKRPVGAPLVIDDTIWDQMPAYMTELGTGIVDWQGWAEVMAGTPSRDTVLIELDAAQDPVAALVAGKALVEEVQR